MRVFNCLGRRCCFGSTEISAVKAKVCYFCGCFNVSMGMKIKKTELGQNRLLKHLQSIVDEKEELPCLLYLIQIFARAISANIFVGNGRSIWYFSKSSK